LGARDTVNGWFRDRNLTTVATQQAGRWISDQARAIVVIGMKIDLWRTGKQRNPKIQTYMK
jgi:hypothetical protein